MASKVVLRFGPGLWIAVGVVENFAEAVGPVTIVLKMLWQRGYLRKCISKMGFVIVGFGRIWAATGEHAGAGGPANCVLSISAFEERAS